jgi:hypothetical protein
MAAKGDGQRNGQKLCVSSSIELFGRHKRLKDWTCKFQVSRTRLNKQRAVTDAGLKRLVNDCNVEPLRGSCGDWVSRAVPAILAFQPQQLNFNDQRK